MPSLWKQKAQENEKVVRMAIPLVYGLDEYSHRSFAVEPMVEEYRISICLLFQNLKTHGLATPRLFISDANAGLIAAIRESFL